MRKAVTGIIVLCVMTALLTSSCAVVGKDFPVDPVTQIKIGETTKVEVSRWFGTPWRTGWEDGQKTWTYGFYRYTLFGTKEMRDLVIRYDERGVVKSYTFSTTDTEL